MNGSQLLRIVNLLHAELCIAQGAHENRRSTHDRALRTNYVRAKLRYRDWFRRLYDYERGTTCASAATPS